MSLQSLRFNTLTELFNFAKLSEREGFFNLHNHLVLNAESTEANDPHLASFQRFQVKFLKKATTTSLSTMQNKALSEEQNEDFFLVPLLIGMGHIHLDL